MLGTITKHFSGFIQQICDNGTIAVRQHFYRNSPGIAGETYIPQCLIDTCWENYLGEKLEVVITAMQELETPIYQVAKSYGIGDAMRSVAGNAVVDTVEEVFNQLMSQKKEIFYSVVAAIVLGKLAFEIKKRMNHRLNLQAPHNQVNIIFAMQAINPPGIQALNHAAVVLANHGDVKREVFSLRCGRS